MKLSIPVNNSLGSASSPAAPHALQKILADLPNSNMGEITRQTFEILKDQNRQQINTTDRLKNLEMIRPHCHKIFQNLKKYFVNRSFPLPEKSKKIVYLNQSILQELIYGYEIIAQESADKQDSTIDKGTISTAICRSINYLYEMLLRACEVYQPCPKNLWYDAHQLYLYAEKNELLSIEINDPETEITTSIADSYKRIILFSLARPSTLRQSDCNRIYNKLFEWSDYTTIKKVAEKDMVDCVFSMRIFEDKAPDYLSMKEISDGMIIRILDNCKLVTHIENLIEEKNRQRKKLVVGDDIPVETLMTLANSWGHNVERRFSRAERHGHINVAIGLKKSCAAIHESKKLVETKPDHIDDIGRRSSRLDNILLGSNHEFFKVSSGANDDQHLTLKSIADDKRQDGYLTTGYDEDNKWDMVAKGRVITETYEKEKQLIDEEQLKDRRKQSDSHWDIVNTSPGGYRLRWDSDDTSAAQIGEIIALQEFDASGDFKWHVGVIRWMQFTQQQGLEIGVQVLSPQVEAATAQRANRLDETPFDCLIMPEIKALNQCASVLLPAHAFNTDNKLIVKAHHNIISVTLGKATEHTGSFTQFNYLSTELDENLKRKLNQEQANYCGDFDELWTSL